MKKLVILSLIFALAATAAFAQIAEGVTMGGWGRAAFAPIIAQSWDKDALGAGTDSDSYILAGYGTTWGVNQPRFSFGITGDWEFTGFQFQFNADPGTGLGVHDNAQIWVKPFSNDYLTVRLAKFKEDTLRGKIGNINNGFDMFTVSQGPEEDGIFQRFETGFGGFMLSSAPIEPLFIGLKIEAPGLWGPQPGDGSYNATTGEPEELSDVFKKIQIGAGYVIDGIGHIRAQYVGGLGELTSISIPSAPGDVPSYDGSFQRVEAAFALTAVENMLLDVGAKIFFPVKDDSIGYDITVTPGFQLNLGWTFSADALKLALRLATDFGASVDVDVSGVDKYQQGLALNAHFVPEYDAGFAVIGADLGLAIKAKDKMGDDIDSSDSTQLGFGVFLRKGFSNGDIQTGLALQLAPTVDGDPAGKTVFSIPVIMHYWF
jgi:hypothetical protein